MKRAEKNVTVNTHLLRAALAIGTITSMFFVPWIFIKIWMTPVPDSIPEQINQALDYGFDGMIVYVDQAGNPPGFYAGGWKDRDNKIPADPHALFKIASISKLYVALAITKLVADGRLSLDKSLADYFPELIERIENSRTITLRMMIQHRSGIPNFTDHPGFWVNPPETNEGKLELILDLPADFEPGSEYAYSNTNYLLLSELIAEVTGGSHHEFIKQEILKPLKLHNTFSSLKEVDVDQVMSGYYVGYDSDLKTVEQGMLATAEDVGIFLRALNDGSVFGPGEEEIYSSIYVYNHTGLVPGYQSIAKYHEDIDAIVIQFTNTTDFSGNNWRISEIVYNRIVSILK